MSSERVPDVTPSDKWRVVRGVLLTFPALPGVVLCRATITFTWPRRLSPRSLRWRLAAASARSSFTGDNNRGQLVTVTLAHGGDRPAQRPTPVTHTVAWHRSASVSWRAG